MTSGKSTVPNIADIFQRLLGPVFRFQELNLSESEPPNIMQIPRHGVQYTQVKLGMGNIYIDNAAHYIYIYIYIYIYMYIYRI